MGDGVAAYADRRPRTAVVIGSGVVGLSTAWFLQEAGVDVTVVDRIGPAAGASRGNAGYVSPGLAIPLNDPSVLRYGLRTLLNPQAPLHVPASRDPALWRFLFRFAAHCTWRAWHRAAHANLPLNAMSLDAFDVLASHGVKAPTTPAPITAMFKTSGHAVGLLRELRRLGDAGQTVSYTALSGAQVRERVPQASHVVGAGIQINDQRYVDPAAFTASLAESLRARGGAILSPFDVVDISGSSRVTVRSATGQAISADVAILATGAWLGSLGRAWGIRVPVRAGRGYSFTVPTDEPVPGPVYLPDVRVACTPHPSGLRVAGRMEFRDADAPLDRARIEAIIKSARPLLSGVRWEERTDEWVGPRPVTPDGRPLVGAVDPGRLYVAGGHGMWGLTHGPITGRLLAEQITTGRPVDGLHDFDPVR